MRPIVNNPRKSQPPVSYIVGLKATCMNAQTGRSATFNRVLIVDNEGIMGAGLESLLSEERESDLIQEIKRFQPDIIILILESYGLSPGRLLELLGDYGRLRFILVSIESKMFEVYDKQQSFESNRITLLEQLKDK